MTANAKTLSTPASPDPGQYPVDLPKPVQVTFTLDQGVTSWGCSPNQLQATEASFEINYSLSTSSTQGWSFSKITIEDPSPSPAWSFTYPNSAGTDTYEITGLMKVTVDSLASTLISVLVNNNNQSASPQTLSVKLTVSNSQGDSHTSPDPQVILEPRPNR